MKNEKSMGNKVGVPDPEIDNEEFDFSDAKRGPVVLPRPNSTLVKIRLDDDILEWFRKRVHKVGGGNYPYLMNNVLRDYINKEGE